MFVMDAIGSMVELSLMNHCNAESRVRIHIGNQLYDVCLLYTSPSPRDI